MLIFLILPVSRNDTVRQIHQFNMWLQDWCHWKNVEFVAGLLTADPMHLSQRGERAVAQELVGLLDRTSK